MYGDKPKLSTPIIALIVAAFFTAVYLGFEWGERTRWLGYFFFALALIFGLVFVVTGANWLWSQLNARLYDSKWSIYAPQIQLAEAVKGLTSYQLDFVAAKDRTIIEMIQGDRSPLFIVRCLNGRYVPWDFVDVFLKKSLETEPNLWPVREADTTFRDFKNPERLASDFTHLLIHRELVDKGSGPYSARIKRDYNLKTLAREYGVDLTEPLIDELPDDEIPDKWNDSEEGTE